MPWNVDRSVGSVKKEVLKFATGLEAIESVVLRASDADTLSSAVTGGVTGRLGLRAGTILTKIPGDSQNRYKKFEDEANEAIECILGDNIYFYDTSEASDEPADGLFHNCVFDKSKIIDFVTYETELRDSLNTSRFD